MLHLFSMPYFPVQDVLLVHIPKTGGTSVERYLVQDAERQGAVPTHRPGPWFTSRAMKLYVDTYRGPGVSPQHQPLRSLVGTGKVAGLCPEYSPGVTTILAVVRDPYARAMSELIWRQLITPETPPPLVFQQLQACIRENRDAHMTPQWEFVTTPEGALDKRVRIMRTETLTDDMHGAGYTDYQGRPSSRSWGQLLGPEYRADQLGVQEGF
jgi:hypothetical protein